MKSVVVFVALIALAACESATTSESIRAWKSTEKGPEKIEAALRNSAVPANLRAEAAVALVEIGRPEKVDDIIGGMPQTERVQVLAPLLEMYVAAMASPQLPKMRDARDELFSLRQYALPDQQKRIDTALLGSIEKDIFAGRFAGGRQSLEKMLLAIGPPSAPMLVRLIADARAPYRGIAELLAKVGDPVTRDRGGSALVERLEHTRAGDRTASDMWIALGLLGGPTVSEFLAGKMQKGSREDAVAAAKALQQSRFPAVLPVALHIAADARADKELRGEVFGVIEKIGGPDALSGLLAIIAHDKNDIVRYRAHEAALEVGKATAILPALEAFAPGLSFRRDDVIDFLVKDISRIGSAAKPQVQAALSSPSPLARMTAVLALEAPLPLGRGQTLGGPDDVAVLGTLGNDRATLKGFPPGMTIGSEAKRVAALLGSKGK
ncbi:MAG: HEAT repeat domain-containing protein [Polyangia bacterium]|jgi:HEAT repeat protein